jgi:gamma-glutamyltranspeptidase/glutathione hydrolase
MRDFQLPGRSVVMSTRGMVSTSQPMATQAALGVLKRGGNAVDAAITAVAVQCVVEPQSTGVGGDCFVLYHEAKTGKLHGLNGSGRAPGKATLETYRAKGLSKVPDRGPLAVTVPGAIDAWNMALERFGTIGLDEALQPAIEFAEEGYAVSPIVSHFWELNAPDLAQFADSRRCLLVEGHAPKPGTIHRQPELGRSMRRIAEGGRNAFYGGPIAEEIVRSMREAGGLMELDDLARYRGEWVEPISTDYRGVRLHEIPPNGQGITALMALNILEGLPIGGMEPTGAERVHAFAEAFKLAGAERDTYVSDPDFNEIPVAGLLSKEFAAKQLVRLDPASALPYPVQSGFAEHRDTICLTVVDRDRNAISFINSLFWNFGSAFVAGNTGITMQNRGAGFVLKEGHFNCIAPRKRPMHTIIPALAYRGKDQILCYGVMGGQYQPMGHAWVLSNIVDCGMDLQEAIDTPRFLPENGQLTVERGVPPATRKALEALGHKVTDSPKPHGGSQAILIDSKAGVLQAGSDPRKDGCAMGW